MDPLFFELHSGLRYEAPGSEADTLKALAMTGLSGPLRILDAGSGPGAASIALLRALPEAHSLAMDLHAPFLDAAQARAAETGVSERLDVACGDMTAPPVGAASLDLVWSEGSIYSVGVGPGLEAWKPCLKPAGRIVFSDVIWTATDPHPDAKAFWDAEYPEMTDRDGVLARISATGLRSMGNFRLPETAWSAYYGPLGARADALAAVHGDDHPAIVETRAEIAMRRDHPEDFGYQFFVVAP